MISLKNGVISMLLCDKIITLLPDRESSGKDEGPVGAKMEMGAMGKYLQHVYMLNLNFCLLI